MNKYFGIYTNVYFERYKKLLSFQYPNEERIEITERNLIVNFTFTIEKLSKSIVA